MPLDSLLLLQLALVAFQLRRQLLLVFQQLLDHGGVFLEHDGQLLLVFGQRLLQLLLQDHLHLLNRGSKHLVLFEEFPVFPKRHHLSLHLAY